MSRGRRRDRRVYLGSHPLLFALLSLTRRSPVRRFGATVLVNGTEAYRRVLTGLPLDRTAVGTTGGVARAAGGGEVLFDQHGAEHRAARRRLAVDVGAAAVARLRPTWQPVLQRRLASLARGATVDVVDLAVEISGVTTREVLNLDPAVDPGELARAALTVAAAGARAHLPGRGLRRPPDLGDALDRLRALMGEAGPGTGPMIAVAAVSTTVAGLPRAVAWCADDRLWDAAAESSRGALVGELLRVTAPSPLLPRAAKEPGEVAGVQIRAGDKLVLLARHAARAHDQDPDPARPAPPSVGQLVFGAGGHACPGAPLARAQLDDVLRALAPYRPVVVRARVDRRAALPSWAELRIRAGR